MWEMFLECGWASWAAVAFAVLTMGLVLLALVLSLLRKRTLAIALAVIALVGALFVIAIGLIGMMMGRSQVDAATSGASVSDEQRARIRTEGYAEAAQCVPVAGGAGAVPLLCAAAVVVVAFARKPQEKKG